MKFTIQCLIVILSFMIGIAYGQITAGQTNSEGLGLVSDSIIKREVSSFTLKGASLKRTDFKLKSELFELPIRECSEEKVALWWTTFFGSLSTFINISFKAEASVRRVDSISLVTHSHFRVSIPKESYADIITNHSCKLEDTYKKSNYYSPNYKAFCSVDRRRFYIYMIGGTATKKYEVTWVIAEGMYLTRIVDDVL